MVTLVYRSAEIYDMSTGSSFNRYSFKIKLRNTVVMLYGVFFARGRTLVGYSQVGTRSFNPIEGSLGLVCDIITSSPADGQ
jgi:hypothetical protein